MIVVDGVKSGLQVNNFGNLEELLVKVAEDNNLEERIVTDVLVNDESFSEIYPHQAEDIDTDEIQKVEIISVPVQEMAIDITEELVKVVNIMDHGGKRVADLFRQADDAEALEVYQDLLDVIRDFMGTISVLRHEFSLDDNKDFNDAVNDISELFTEMSDVMENEDWILLADILEYEFAPSIERWKKVVNHLRTDIQAMAA